MPTEPPGRDVHYGVINVGRGLRDRVRMDSTDLEFSAEFSGWLQL